MADVMLIEVLFGRRILAGPCPFSNSLVPVIVVIKRLKGDIYLKYLLSFNIVWDVPLSSTQVFRSEREGQVVLSLYVVMCVSGGGTWSLYLVKSSWISK